MGCKICLSELLIIILSIPFSSSARSVWAPLDSSWAKSACSSADNSTRSLLKCLAARFEFGDAASDFSPESFSPTDEAENAAVRHIHEVSKDAGADWAFLRHGRALTQHFQDQLLEWHSTGEGMPRLFLLKEGAWERSCEWMQDSLGYRYSLEHWFHKLFHNMKGVHVTEHIAAADFVYLPHCATGIFMHASAKESLKDQWGPPPRPGRNSSVMRESRRALTYEGNLQPAAIQYTEETYLVRLAKNKWSEAPEYHECWRRPDCRFLVVSIYGRHVWRSFSDIFGQKAVFVTHAGLSPYLSKQRDEFFDLRDEDAHRSGANPASGASIGCRAVCVEHCRLNPPGVLDRDIVLPWTVAYRWTKRSQVFHSRNVLAFYSGTGNSCSRTRLKEVFTDHYNAELGGLFKGDDRGDAANRNRILVFPPEFRLTQEAWSELAFRSKLCIVPDGDSPNTGRLVEVVMHGCVPLIISNRLQPPLHEFINWHAFAFFLREDAIPRLPQILRKLAQPQGKRRIAEKQKSLAQVSYILDYNRDIIGSMFLLSLRDRRREVQSLDARSNHIRASV